MLNVFPKTGAGIKDNYRTVDVFYVNIYEISFILFFITTEANEEATESRL